MMGQQRQRKRGREKRGDIRIQLNSFWMERSFVIQSNARFSNDHHHHHHRFNSAWSQLEVTYGRGTWIHTLKQISGTFKILLKSAKANYPLFSAATSSSTNSTFFNPAREPVWWGSPASSSSSLSRGGIALERIAGWYRIEPCPATSSSSSNDTARHNQPATKQHSAEPRRRERIYSTARAKHFSFIPLPSLWWCGQRGTIERAREGRN